METNLKMNTSENCCRCCLNSSQNNLLDIFEENCDRIYFNCTQLVISNDDLYPKFICKNCFDELKKWEIFKKQCEDSLSEYFLEFISVAPKIESPVDVKVENSDNVVEDEETQENSSIIERSVTKRKPRTSKVSRNSKESSTKPRIHCEVQGCNISFILQENYEGHLREHQGLKAGFCKICNKTFNTVRLMRRHLVTHTTLYNFACKKCDQKFKSSDTLLMHDIRMHREHKFKCDCGKSFPSAAQYKVHQTTHSTERNFQCTICLKWFKAKKFLTKHQLVHSEFRPFVCEICGHTSKSSYTAKVHKLTHEETRKKYPCQLCSKTYLTSTALSNHIKFHTGQRDYVCDLCARNFSTKAVLKRHFLVHLDEKKYVCRICDKGFKRDHHLKTHMNIH